MRIYNFLIYVVTRISYCRIKKHPAILLVIGGPLSIIYQITFQYIELPVFNI